MTEHRQRLVVNLPPDTSLASDINRCGEAVREVMNAMSKRQPGFVGACRLVSRSPSAVTYEVWLQKKDSDGRLDELKRKRSQA